MGRFETECLAADENLAALVDLSGQWIDLVHAQRPPKAIVLDMDSSVSPTHGDRGGNAYNGHFACTCYHPRFVFNQCGDLERCVLRPGNIHSADGWRSVLEPIVIRYRDKVERCALQTTNDAIGGLGSRCSRQYPPSPCEHRPAPHSTLPRQAMEVTNSSQTGVHLVNVG